MNANRIKVPGIALIVGLGMPGAQAATNHAPADQSGGTTASAAAQQALEKNWAIKKYLKNIIDIF